MRRPVKSLSSCPPLTECNTYTQRMPHAREWACDDVQHVYTKFQEGDVVVLDPTKIALRAIARDEKGYELLRLGAILLVCERSAIRQPLLHGCNFVEQPRGVDERGVDCWAWSAE